jgi:hypothetical protein
MIGVGDNPNYKNSLKVRLNFFWTWQACLAPTRLTRNTATSPHECVESLRVLAVVPGDGQGSSMIFVRRQIASLLDLGVNVRTFFLQSRTSPVAIAREWSRLRRQICQFRPHLVHAHYGTVTSFLCAVATNIPLVITFR